MFLFFYCLFLSQFRYLRFYFRNCVCCSLYSFMFSFQRPTDSFRVVYYYIATNFVCQHFLKLFLFFLKYFLTTLAALFILLYSTYFVNNKFHFFLIFFIYRACARVYACIMRTYARIIYIDISIAIRKKHSNFKLLCLKISI